MGLLLRLRFEGLGYPEVELRTRLLLSGPLAIALLAGCGSTPPPTSGERPHVSPALIRHFHDVPSAPVLRACKRSRSQGTILIPCVAWEGAHTLDVVTLGSGSCPKLPTSVVARAPNMIAIVASDDVYATGVMCTADLSPTTSVLRIPATINSSKTVRVQIDGTIVEVAALGTAVVPDVSSQCLTVQRAIARLEAAGFQAQGLPASPGNNRCMPRGGVVAQSTRARLRAPLGTVIFVSNV